MTDLLTLTAALVDVPSLSHHEKELADHIEQRLSAVSGLAVDRLGDNVVARTDLDRERRLVLAGHTDTVLPNGNERSRLEGDTLWGLGAADMKGALAVMLELAATIPDPQLDVTYVFYAREEVASRHSGLLELFGARPELVRGDVALLGEPTANRLEAGCQGTMRLRVALGGERAHTARPWLGSNAIHRLGEVLGVLNRYEGRRPVLDGCEYREILQAVFVEGGVGGNVVPDHAELVLNHRFAPDRSAEAAEHHVRELLAGVLGETDQVEVVELAPAAPPALGHPFLSELVGSHDLDVRGKLGWTDVARFAEHGIPAANFGPGDPDLAHSAGERITRGELERSFAVLHSVLAGS